MSLQIDEALREGFGRTVGRNGLALIGVFVLFGFVNAAATQSLSAQSLDALDRIADQPLQQPGGNPLGPGTGGATPFALPIPLPVAAALTVLLPFVAEALRIVGIRAFAGDEVGGVPAGVGRRLALATLNGFVGGVVALVLTAVGTVLFVIPGIYIGISLFFVRQEIALADKNFIDALGDSWSLTEGNRWELLGLAVIVVVINLVASSPTLVLSFLSQAVSSAASVVISGATTVFGIAVATRAYVQLREADAVTEDGDVDDAWDDPDGVDDGWNTRGD